ncbi:4584_t:CDS:2 [Paraglomus occultum]|uniref:4584_t:CDS:1 n=1 Tax=Paraglomus occultum TaxID=144539 RepID=A0A9N8W3K7_9GLOM|nr:4584_t:CDS:2 [Paraglomus occultum]
MSPTKVLKNLSVDLQFTIPPSNVPIVLTISLEKDQLFVDTIRHFMEVNNVPCYLEMSILSTVETLMNEDWRKSIEHNAKVTSNGVATVQRQLLVSKYQKYTVRYNDTPAEDIFPKAHHTLVRSPASSIFDILLKLERSYSQALKEVRGARDRELMMLKERHNEEMRQNADLTNDFEIQQLVSKHYEEQELAQATRDSELDQMRYEQKQEYCSFILKLYEAYQRFLSEQQSSSDPASAQRFDGKELVSEVIAEMKSGDKKLSKQLLKIDADEQGKRSRHGSVGSLAEIVGTPPLPTPTSPKVFWGEEKKNMFLDDDDPQVVKSIGELQVMGFEPDQARLAFELAKGNMEQAIALLVDQPDKIAAQLAASSSSAPPRRPSVPAISSNQKDAPPTHRRAKSFNKSQSLAIQTKQEGKKAWSPISFFQQQKNSIPNSASVRKIGTWLGKAIEGLGFEDGSEHNPRISLEDPELVESFTISLGNQVKSTHNLRLLVSDMDDLFKSPNDEVRDMAYRAQTTADLYSQNLTAVVLLLTPKDWPKYKLGQSANAEFFQRCKESTEFHFDDIDYQLKLIEEDFMRSASDDAIPIREGDFFITRHSNLPLVHIVFHLVIDFESIERSEISQRSPVIAGLRNILRTVNRFDITAISIPFLLLPSNVDVFADLSVDENILYKRGELVLKCTKGFMIENSRVPKHVTEKEHETKTVQFLLPKSANEQQFQSFRFLLTSIFKTS